MTKKTRSSVWPGVIAFVIATAYLIALLDVERQNLIIALLAAGIAVVIAGAWFGVLDSVSASLFATRFSQSFFFDLSLSRFA